MSEETKKTKEQVKLEAVAKYEQGYKDVDKLNALRAAPYSYTPEQKKKEDK